MALEKAVITAAESQAILSAEADWIALDSAVQEQHVAFGSVYAQTKWNCIDSSTGIDMDWTDAPDDVKEAIAYYSLANLRGTLYPDTNVQSDAGGGDITEITKKLGTMQKTIKYNPPGSQAKNPLTYPDVLMGSLCERSRGNGGSVKLYRC